MASRNPGPTRFHCAVESPEIVRPGTSTCRIPTKPLSYAVGRGAGHLHARQRGHAGRRLREERRERVGLRTDVARRHPEQQDPAAIEADILRVEFTNGSSEQPGRRRQRQCQAHLEDHQGAAAPE